MGTLIIHIPQRGERTYTVTNEELAATIIAAVEAERPARKKNPDAAASRAVLGIWKNRFNGLSPAQIGKKIRKEAWDRS